MARLTPDEVVDRYEALESERRVLDAQLELLERFVMPGKGRFFTDNIDNENSIDWSHREIYDGTANHSAVLLAANIHGNLTSPAATWFELRFRDDQLNDNREASVWLEDCGMRIRSAINDSNFSLEANEFYLDGVGFGTALMLHNETMGPALQWNGFRFKSEMLRFCYFEENAEGEVTGIFIKRSYTPMQLVLKFGADAVPENVTERMRDQSQSTTEKDFEVVLAIYLDEDKRDTSVAEVLPPESRPYAMQWVMIDQRHQLGPSQGFYEMPGYVLRWQRTAGSKYGHSPGVVALGDILTLQEMVQMVRTATQKTVDPPMQSTRKGAIGDIDMEAGGLTPVRDIGALMPLMPPGAYRVDAGWQDIADLRQRIEKYFYVDVLQLKESPAMTATEVQTRYEMMQRTLGPTLGRIQSDFLDPLIERCFWMMFRKGALLPMPEIVKQADADLDIEYVGPLPRAQKLESVDSTQRWVGMTAQTAQIKPEVLDIIDFDEVTKHLADTLGVPAKLVKSEQDVAKLRKERSAQAAQAQQMEQLEQGASAVKDLGQSGMLSGGMGGAAPEETVQ